VATDLGGNPKPRAHDGSGGGGGGLGGNGGGGGIGKSSGGGRRGAYVWKPGDLRCRRSEPLQPEAFLQDRLEAMDVQVKPLQRVVTFETLRVLPTAP
jgi:hypothetical protein